MPKIVFRGKTYNSVFDMPDDVRKAFHLEKRSGTKNEAEKLLTDFVEMSDDLRELYERAAGKVDMKPLHTRGDRSENDDAFYRPSPSPITSTRPAIEPDDGLRRLVLTVLFLLAIGGVVFFMVLFAS